MREGVREGESKSHRVRFRIRFRGVTIDYTISWETTTIMVVRDVCVCECVGGEGEGVPATAGGTVS